MKPEKLDEVVRLMKLLDELYCMYRLNSRLGVGFTYINKRLRSGHYSRVSVNSQRAFIDMRGKKFEGCAEFLYFESPTTTPIQPEIWNDDYAIFPTGWSYDWIKSRGIRRASSGRLDKMAQTYPVLEADTSLEPDIIDPIIFQNLTRYTMNEVLTQLIALQIHPHKKLGYKKDEKDFFCTMKLDYSVLDILSTKDILELIEVLETEIQELRDGTDNV